jgi:oligopeptide/dipeptide ABC transporter ATP-binding protein
VRCRDVRQPHHRRRPRARSPGQAAPSLHAGLLKASPTLKRGALTPIPGAVPQLTALPPGCAFEPRCELRREECAAAIPALRIVASDHAARCILV